MYESKNNYKRQENPIKKANILSLITSFYTFNLLKKAYKKDLEENDIYEVVDEFDANRVGDIFQHQWDKEKQRSKTPSLYRAVWSCYGKQYLLLGVLQLLVTTTIIFFQPTALGKVISYFTHDTKISKQEAVYNVILIIVMNVFHSFYINFYLLKMMDYGLKLKTGISSTLYRKCLKLSISEIKEFSTGNILTLINKDVNTFEFSFIFVNDMWISVLHIGIITYILYEKLGYCTFIAIGIAVLIIMLQVYLGKKVTDIRIESGKMTDERIQVTQETLSAIKIIKMYTWEKFFAQKISAARKCEIKKIQQSYLIKAIAYSSGDISVNITFLVLLITYIGIGNKISAEIVYFTLSCINAIRMGLTVIFPLCTTFIGDINFAFHRIKILLLSEELSKKEKPIIIEKSEPTIELINVTIKVQNKIILQDITVTLHKGIHLLTGSTGSGKSSFLKAILKEFITIEGKLNITGRISYAPGEPWLFPVTIKQNILFGEKYNKIRYKKILEICTLNYDLLSFPKGDETLICDQGLNISKGQQARINLARAIYKESDIYLLDDCLSSLDSDVQDHIFQKCIKEFLTDKLIILVSHTMKYLKEADSILVVKNKSISNIKSSENYYFESKLNERICNSLDHINEDDIDKNIITQNIDDCSDEMKSLLPKYDSAIYQETNAIGKVDSKMYLFYIKFGGGILMTLGLLILYIVSQGIDMYTYKLLSIWVNIGEKLLNETDSFDNSNTQNQFNDIIITYSIFTATAAVLTLIKTNLLYIFLAKANKNIHKVIVQNSIYATMDFFDTHLIGNILNRFSKDVGTLDDYLIYVMYQCFKCFCLITGTIILIASANTTLLIPIILISIIVVLARKFYIPCGRNLKRLEAATRSPIIGHLNATIKGLTIIRAHGKLDDVQYEFDQHQNLYTSTYHMSQHALRTFCLSIELLNTLFISLILVVFLVFENSTLAGNVGLSITQALSLTRVLQWSVTQWAELENQMTSVERIMEYTNIKKEEQDGKSPKNWPQTGSIKYQNVKLSYIKKENVLNDINFSIRGGEKIGIVGRTGSGKSSIISSLFRMYKTKGHIFIDDVDINTLSLNFLRSKLAIIPQDPILFTGTIRNNIDPNEKFSDEEIWSALKMVGLNKLINNINKLTKESEFEFSSGEKQLLCLARALIQKNKILILDETTSCMDLEKDELIHDVIKNKFSDCTILTIAHRLHSVLNSDKVMVLEDGKILEFGNPDNLLKNHESRFYKMVKKSDADVL